MLVFFEVYIYYNLNKVRRKNYIPRLETKKKKK